MGTLKLKKKNFTAIRLLSFLKDVDTEKALVKDLKALKNSFGRKNKKYSIGYLYNDIKVRPFRKMLPKTSAYVKSYDGQTKWMYSLIKDDDLSRNIILFEITSALI